MENISELNLRGHRDAFFPIIIHWIRDTEKYFTLTLSFSKATRIINQPVSETEYSSLSKSARSVPIPLDKQQ